VEFETLTSGESNLIIYKSTLKINLKTGYGLVDTEESYWRREKYESLIASQPALI